VLIFIKLSTRKAELTPWTNPQWQALPDP